MYRSIALVSLIFICSCSKTSQEDSPLFDSLPLKKSLQPQVNEISGIAPSLSFPGSLWAVEDGGNPARLYLINADAQVVKTIQLKNVQNRDWEEMALFDGTVYISETGDNGLQYPEYAIYRFPEPQVLADTVYTIEKIRFIYPDGSKDCEAMLVDPSGSYIYFFTKNPSGSNVYKLSLTGTVSGLRTLEPAGQMNIGNVVAATLSPDKKEIIIKTYLQMFLFPVKNGESMEQIIAKEPVVIPYEPEPQGEAVCFANDNSGYYTLSEKGFSNEVFLNFYKRK